MLNLYLFFTISKKERYEVSTRWQTDSTCLNPDSSYPECRHWSYFQASKKKPPEYCKIAGKASFHLTIYFILQSILYRMPLTGRGDSSRNSSASPGHALRGAVSISTEAKYLTPQPWLSVSNLNLSGYQYHSASLICLYSFSTSSLTASPSEKALALPAATPMRKACS